MRYEKHIPKYMAFFTYLAQGARDIQLVCHLVAGKSSAFPCTRLETGARFMVQTVRKPFKSANYFMGYHDIRFNTA